MREGRDERGEGRGKKRKNLLQKSGLQKNVKIESTPASPSISLSRPYFCVCSGLILFLHRGGKRGAKESSSSIVALGGAESSLEPPPPVAIIVAVTAAPLRREFLRREVNGCHRRYHDLFLKRERLIDGKRKKEKGREGGGGK